MTRGTFVDSKGFTVIESLVVILIITLLGSIVIAGLSKKGKPEPEVPAGSPVPSELPVTPEGAPKESPDDPAPRKIPAEDDSAAVATPGQSIG